MTKKKIVAATGCPTGIAHTFMAAESLKKTAEKMGVEIKVETHGQVGVENGLTVEEIREADGVIVAADKDVNTDRFHGKPIVEVAVAKGIKAPGELINQILNNEAPIHHVSGHQENDVGGSDESNKSESDTKNSRKWLHSI